MNGRAAMVGKDHGRLFFAVWPPPRVAEALAGWARGAARQCGGRPVRAESLHLTLAFLGEAEIAPARAAAAGVRGSAHRLPIERTRAWKHNRIVWAGPERAPPALAALAADLREALARAGFELEAREFAAHVTLLRKAACRGPLPPLPSVEWPVSEWTLVRSVPAPEGSRYEVIERFPLQR